MTSDTRRVEYAASFGSGDHEAMHRRALSFGSAAAAYERFRPDYPPELADAIVDYAGTPIRTALEIGAGTGKATRLFAARGVAVTATEPDAAMVDQLRNHVDDSVTVVRTPFEKLVPNTTYDLVFVAAALHWTAPQQRWQRIARLLVPGGYFANIGGPTRLADDDLDAAVRTARSPWLDDDDVPSPDGTPPAAAMQWPGTELQRSELFTDVRHLRIERRLRVPATDYLGLLSTISAYLQLPDDDRTRTFEAIAAVLPAEVELVADLELHLARHTAGTGRSRLEQ